MRTQRTKMEEVMAKIDKMIARIDVNQAACLEGEERTSVDMEPEVAHQEIPREDTTTMPVGGLRKRLRD
jgi:hypothetical protein